MVIDFYAKNFEGNVNVYTKHLSNQGSWISVPSMQNINLGFDIESMGNYILKVLNKDYSQEIHRIIKN